jgi:ribonuclease P protein component
MAKSGTKSVQNGLILVAQKAELDREDIRVGYVVTKKLGNSPIRNRIKRRLRNVAREVISELGQPGYDYVIIARKQSIDRQYNLLGDDLRKACLKIS